MQEEPDFTNIHSTTQYQECIKSVSNTIGVSFGVENAVERIPRNIENFSIFKNDVPEAWGSIIYFHEQADYDENYDWTHFANVDDRRSLLKQLAFVALENDILCQIERNRAEIEDEYTN